MDSDKEYFKYKIETIIKEVLKVQNTFISLNSSSQWNAEAAINSMKQQLEKTLTP
jgi:hypothetical protein